MPPSPSPPGWDRLDRPPLGTTALRRALVDGPTATWRALDVVQVTGSTNADVAARARAGEPAGLVLVAEHQTAGRGRRERSWESPSRAGLALSVLLRPEVPPARLGWLPLLGGLAVAEAVRRVCGLQAVLKWPNDVLVPVPGSSGPGGPGGPGKLSGLLAEVVTPDAVVLGIGLNVTQEQGELPPPIPGGIPATSLKLAGSATTDRDTVLRAVLRSLAERYAGWQQAGGDPVGSGLAAAYRETCETIGRGVEVHLPDGSALRGEAEGVDDEGRLLVRAAPGDRPDGLPGDGEVRALSAGDVVHVRRNSDSEGA